MRAEFKTVEVNTTTGEVDYSGKHLCLNIIQATGAKVALAGDILNFSDGSNSTSHIDVFQNEYEIYSMLQSGSFSIGSIKDKKTILNPAVLTAGDKILIVALYD